ENTATGESREVPLLNEVGAWPKFVGSHPDCEICVPGLAEKEVELVPSGMHIGIKALSANVRVGERSLDQGQMTRMDGGTFQIAEFVFELGWPDEPDGE